MPKNSLRRTIAQFIDPTRKTYNKFSQAFYGLTGIPLAIYDDNSTTYIEKGYNYNPVVYSVVKSISDKAKSVPFYIKKVADERSMKRANELKGATHPQLVLKRSIYESKAFEEKIYDFPMDKPNPLQSWADIKALYETFLFTKEILKSSSTS